MTLRFKLFGAFFVVLMLVSLNGEMRMFGHVGDLFLGLLVFFVLGVIIMWPHPERADRIDRAVDGASWADRVEIEAKTDNVNSTRPY